MYSEYRYKSRPENTDDAVLGRLVAVGCPMKIMAHCVVELPNVMAASVRTSAEDLNAKLLVYNCTCFEN